MSHTQRAAPRSPVYVAILLAAAVATMTIPRDVGAHYRALGSFVMQAIVLQGQAERALIDGATGELSLP